MCGRFVLATPPASLAERFSARLSAAAQGLLPSWNVAPSREILGLVLDEDGARLLDLYRWGLVPSWAKDPSIGARLFNARAETLADKPAFRSALRSRRLAVLADGFYEWAPAGRVRQPYYLTRSDGAPLALAGLWESWRDPARRDEHGAWTKTATIVTTGAGADVASIHERMPVVLAPGALERWLDPALSDREELAALCGPAAAGTLVARRVGRRVGNVRNDDPSLVDEDAEPPSTGPSAEQDPVRGDPHPFPGGGGRPAGG